eukprot:scaffold58745_cov66-Phaeocystis_antarctica.AAC.3
MSPPAALGGNPASTILDPDEASELQWDRRRGMCVISGSVDEESPPVLAPPDHSVVTRAPLRIPTTGACSRAH